MELNSTSLLLVVKCHFCHIRKSFIFKIHFYFKTTNSKTCYLEVLDKIISYYVKLIKYKK